MATYVVIIVAIALIFDFSNGFHDSANSIATIVGTRVLSPGKAVIWAAFFNFAAAFTVGTAVAKTVGKGMVDISIVTPSVILAGLLGAILWNIITWYFGLPSSSSHALLGGYAGGAIAKAGFGAIIWSGWTKTLVFIVLSPIIGLILGFTLMVAAYWLFHRTAPAKVEAITRPAQLVSSAFFSLSHGGNDAQKTMGIIVGLLIASQPYFAHETGWLHHFYVTEADGVPLWVEMAAYSAISLGTLFGGWRIVNTMGSRLTKLRPVGGFCAEVSGAFSIMLATKFGIPVSTTHAITGAIVGVGSVQGKHAVRWGLAGRIVWGWVLTIPFAALMAALCYMGLQFFSP